VPFLNKTRMSAAGDSGGVAAGVGVFCLAFPVQSESDDEDVSDESESDESDELELLETGGSSLGIANPRACFKSFFVNLTWQANFKQ
jgi:hypothetical protein